MNIHRTTGLLLVSVALGALVLPGCTTTTGQATNSTTGATASATTAAAVAPAASQTNPPGDIPDTQLFVTFRSPIGYSVLFPEGWSRSTSGSTVTFTSNYDGEQIAVRPKADPRADVRAMFPGASALKMSHVVIHGAPSTLLTFSSTSKQDAVTGRSITLENESYVVSHGSREAILTLWAPKGSDNVDQWKKISQSLQWR